MINNHKDVYNVHFKSLDGIKKWFIKTGVEKELILDDDDFIALDNLKELLEHWEVEVYNQSLCEQGFSSFFITLTEIDWEED
jgi:hypothetical protein